MSALTLCLQEEGAVLASKAVGLIVHQAEAAPLRGSNQDSTVVVTGPAKRRIQARTIAALLAATALPVFKINPRVLSIGTSES